VELSESEVRRIGKQAQERALSEHTSEHRAIEFERELENLGSSAGTTTQIPVALGSG
jgi:hypothetical protein